MHSLPLVNAKAMSQFGTGNWHWRLWVMWDKGGWDNGLERGHTIEGVESASAFSHRRKLTVFPFDHRSLQQQSPQGFQLLPIAV